LLRKGNKVPCDNPDKMNEKLMHLQQLRKGEKDKKNAEISQLRDEFELLEWLQPNYLTPV
jgi:hypothetical protein